MRQIDKPQFSRTSTVLEEKRLPVGPLFEASGVETGAALARRIGVLPSTVSRWRSRGLTFWAADNAASRIGIHPLLVWPTWADVRDEDREVAEAA
jgi:hypothetical protein